MSCVIRSCKVLFSHCLRCNQISTCKPAQWQTRGEEPQIKMLTFSKKPRSHRSHRVEESAHKQTWIGVDRLEGGEWNLLRFCPCKRRHSCSLQKCPLADSLICFFFFSKSGYLTKERGEISLPAVMLPAWLPHFHMWMENEKEQIKAAHTFLMKYVEKFPWGSLVN